MTPDLNNSAQANERRIQLHSTSNRNVTVKIMNENQLHGTLEKKNSLWIRFSKIQNSADVLEASGMAQGVKAPSIKSDDLSSSPRTHEVDGENHTRKLISDLHPFTLTGTHVNITGVKN